MKRELRFNEEGKFKVLQFTDIHYTDGGGEDHKTTELMERLIKEEQPDFIITTGDTVYGPDNTKHIEEALRPIIDSGIPFTYVFGNHDTEEGEGYDVLFPRIEKLPNCMAFNADKQLNGTGNHFLTVDDKAGQIKWVLFAVDSLNYNPLKSVGGYDYVKWDQIFWYKETMKQLEKENPDFQALTFMHMALPEFHELWDMEVCYGEKREGIGSPRINSGFFTAMLEAGHTKGLFVGHDHINDFMGQMYGIWLGYGRATGYHTYGEEGFLKGCRVFVLSEDSRRPFETYVVLENGTRIKSPKEHRPERIRDEG